MLLDFSEQLLIKLESELRDINAKNSDPGNKLTLSLNLIRKRLGELRQYIIKNPFKDAHQEEHFFKEIKPKVYAIYLYEVSWNNIETNKPFGTAASQIAYYQDELKRLGEFFKRHAFHYEYFRWQLTDLDSLYFRRGIDLPKLPLVDMPGLDPDFSTPLDYLYSKFIAYEKLQHTIFERIRQLNQPMPVNGNETVNDSAGLLKWTGEAINLVELAYGIWLTGQINHGNAGISEIIRWLEGNLQIKIGRAYRRWTEITRRKRLTTTKYMDQMRDLIHKRIDDENSYSLK